MTNIKVDGMITKKDVLKYAAEQGYDIEMFLRYLDYQKKATNQTIGDFKMSVEECALGNPELDMNSNRDLEWYSKWMGFGDRWCIPSEYYFDIFCQRRDVYMHEPHYYRTLQRINSDNEIYVFRDDNLQCLKITECNNAYNINIKGRDKLDLRKFNQEKNLAMTMVTEKSDDFCQALEKFYNNLNQNSFSCNISKGVKGNIEVISGVRGFSLFADVNYLEKPPFSISMDISKKNNKEAFSAVEALYSDLDDMKIKSGNIDTCLTFLNLKAK